MNNRVCEQFQKLLTRAFGLLIFSVFFIPLQVLAEQEAIVIVEQAVIYSDQQMSSSVGYVKKGRKITIGEVARNNSQVYPIIVSGKVAYIKTSDVSTDVDEPTMVDLERFRKQTKVDYKTKYTLSAISYLSTVAMSGKGNDEGMQDGDSFNWLGAGLKGEAFLSYNLDLQLLTNFLTGTARNETLRMVEAGLGAGFRLIDFSRFKVTGEVQLLGIPYASYAYRDQFRVNGYGVSAGGGGTAYIRLGENFGIEGSVGVYYTKLSGFKPPKQFEAIVPGFIGTRISGGLNYMY